MTKDLNVFDKHYGLLINGEWTNGSEGNTLTAYNPANGETLATFIDATDADVDAAVNAAKEAFKTWKNTSATERATILNKIADIIDENLYAEYLEKHPVYFFGNGAAKCKEKLSHPNAHFIENIHPVAKWMFPLAEKAMAVEDFKDVAYFEPFYLKEFVASTPKKLL